MSCPDQIQPEFSVAFSLVRILWQQLNRIYLYRSLCTAYKTIYVPLYNDTYWITASLSLNNCWMWYLLFIFHISNNKVDTLFLSSRKYNEIFFFYLLMLLDILCCPERWSWCCRPDNQCDDFRTTRDLVLNNHVLSSMVSLDDKAYSRESRKEWCQYHNIPCFSIRSSTVVYG